MKFLNLIFSILLVLIISIPPLLNAETVCRNYHTKFSHDFNHPHNKNCWNTWDGRINNMKNCTDEALCCFTTYTDKKKGMGWDSSSGNYYWCNFAGTPPQDFKCRLVNPGLLAEHLVKKRGLTCGVKTKKLAQVYTSPLRLGFISLSKQNRKQVQSNLSDLGLYTSSIDGLYGKNTESALKAYNKNKLGGLNLENKQNVEKVISKILKLPNTTYTQKNNPSLNVDLKKVSSGTGFFISEKGHVLTNYHVVNGCEKVKTHNKGISEEASVVAIDRLNDIAVLKVKNKPSTILPISKKNPYPLQEIIVAGFPFGDVVSSSIKFTKGIVSAMSGYGDNYSQIQIDAALQPGNSGGPIVDEYGNVVGVAVSKLDLKTALKGFGVVPENTNFGIKSTIVINLLEGNNIELVEPNENIISKADLSRNMTEGTTYLSCWMTDLQIKKIKTKKVLFPEFE